LLHCATVPFDVVVEKRVEEVCEIVVVVIVFVVVEAVTAAEEVVTTAVEVMAADVVAVTGAHGTLQLRGHEAISLGLEHVKIIHSGASCMVEEQSNN
jgi:hypothetical protein